MVDASTGTSLGSEARAVTAVPLSRVWPAPRLDPAELALIADETPFLAYDLSVVTARTQALQQAFDSRVGVRYAVKCNPDERVLATVLATGAGFEIASASELAMTTLAGADPTGVLYSNPVKPPSHVRAAFEAGVHRFAVDCHEEVLKIAQHAPGAGVFVRVRVDDSSSRFPLSSKFGTSHDDARRLLQEARRLGLVPYGLTFHVGSQCTDVNAWAHAVALCAPVMADLLADGIELPMLDLGGGFPAHYDALEVPDVVELAGRALDAIDALPYVPRELVCEPGRALVAEAATLATTVIGRTERNGRHWVFLDVGAYNGMMECAQTQGRMAFPLSTGRPTGPLVRCTVTGPSCDSSDTLFRDALLPSDLEVGDRVYIGSAGAYSLCYAAPFNGFPVPVPVYLS
jgi:ornithine decarboxylase